MKMTLTSPAKVPANLLLLRNAQLVGPPTGGKVIVVPPVFAIPFVILYTEQTGRHENDFTTQR